MGVFRFIIGVLGILLIIGTFSSFLLIAFLGGISSGSVYGLALPIILFVIGAVMVYFGFYSTGGYHHFKYGFFVKWGLIYAGSVFLFEFLNTKLKITNSLLIILFAGIVVILVASIIRHKKTNIKNFVLYWLFFSTIYWLSINYTLDIFGINNKYLQYLFIGFSMITGTTILRKFNIKKKTNCNYRVTCYCLSNIQYIINNQFRFIFATDRP